jgi:hypothetical protein
MNHSIKVFALSLSLACGAAVDGEELDQELAQVEQAYTIQQSTSGASRLWSGFQFGSNLSCKSDQAESTECSLPGDKSPTYRVINGTTAMGIGPCTSGELAQLGAAVDLVIPVINSNLGNSGWTAARNDSDTEADLTVVCDGLSTATGFALNSYVQSQSTFNVQLTESLPGTFFKIFKGLVKVKIKALNTLGNSAANDTKLINHVTGNVMIKPLGVGNSNAVTNVYSVDTLSQNDPNTGFMSSGQLCRTKKLDPSGLNLSVSSSGKCSNN